MDLFNRKENAELRSLLKQAAAKISALDEICATYRERLAKTTTISEEERKILLRLIHPDKHQGSKIAEAMFKRFNQ